MSPVLYSTVNNFDDVIVSFLLEFDRGTAVNHVWLVVRVLVWTDTCVDNVYRFDAYDWMDWSVHQQGRKGGRRVRGGVHRLYAAVQVQTEPG
jgi:hypothetical protein